MKIFDMQQREVVCFESFVSCCPFSMPSVDVKLPNGQIIGRIEQDLTFFIPKFTITNARFETILRIEGPITTVSFGNDVEFDVSCQFAIKNQQKGESKNVFGFFLHSALSFSQIYNLSGVKIGKIAKQWSGLAREFFTDLEYFGIQFPMDLDVYTKFSLLGACMLIVNIFKYEMNYWNLNELTIINMQTLNRALIFRMVFSIRNNG